MGLYSVDNDIKRMVKSYPFATSAAPPSGKPEKTSHSADRQFVHVCTISDEIGGGLSWGLPWFTTPKMVISSRVGKPPISMEMAPVAGMLELNAPRKSIPSMTGILTPGMARRTMEKGEAQESFQLGCQKESLGDGSKPCTPGEHQNSW